MTVYEVVLMVGRPLAKGLGVLAFVGVTLFGRWAMTHEKAYSVEIVKMQKERDANKENIEKVRLAAVDGDKEIIHRLERIEDKLDKIIEREIGKPK